MLAVQRLANIRPGPSKATAGSAQVGQSPQGPGYNHTGIKCPAHNPTPVALTSVQRENNALVLYRVSMPSNYCDRLNALYYTVQCSTTSTTDKQGNLVCQNGGTWNWVVNDTGQP